MAFSRNETGRLEAGSPSDDQGPRPAMISRRWVLGGMALAPAVAAKAASPSPILNFDKPAGLTLLNNAGTHLMPRVAADAARTYLDQKASGAFPPGFNPFSLLKPARTAFARLINAQPEEVALVQSTLAGENLIVSGMGLPHAKGNIVTDALHYDGSLYIYESIKSRDLDVRIVAPREFGIDLEDLDRAIDRDTKLVAISMVSSVNGFAHDLKAVCDIAHAKGVPVYADIVQAAGTLPIDVKASGVDFAAGGSYKWLMGDMGAGFLYARREHLGELVKRSSWGYLQCRNLRQHAFDDPRSPTWPISYEQGDEAKDYFEVGTPAIAALITLDKTLALIDAIGVERIAAHNQALIDRLKAQLPSLGYALRTPLHNKSPTALFAVANTEKLRSKFAAAGIKAGIRSDEVRFSPGLYNDIADIERVIDVMS